MGWSKINVKHFVEDIGLFFEQMGLPRMAGRVLGVLLISVPEEQSLNDICEILQVSKSGVSTMSRYLVNVGLIEKVPSPMPRRDYFRFKQGGWMSFMQQRMEIMAALHEIVERGLDILDGQENTLKQRLFEAHDVFAFVEKEFPRWLEKMRNTKEKLK